MSDILDSKPYRIISTLSDGVNYDEGGPYADYICNGEENKDKVPKNARPGSIMFVTNKSKLKARIMNDDKTWSPLSIGEGGGGSAEFPEGDPGQMLMYDTDGDVVAVSPDVTPTADSANPITSGAVASALEGVTKKPYQRRTFWTQKINATRPITDFGTNEIDSVDSCEYYDDKCVLYLPDSYDPKGAPTKLIIFCKEGASEITSTTDTILPRCAFFLKLGYAIVGVEGIPDGICNSKTVGKRTVGNYMHLNSTIKAYEKVVEEYNIDRNGCYIYGYSQGGHTLLNLMENSNLPILCGAAQSPALSMRYHQWDLPTGATRGDVAWSSDGRLSVARLYGYPAVSTDEELMALEYDASKTNGWDPFTRNVENPYSGFVKGSNNLWNFPSGTTIDDITMVKRMKRPFKIWCANNDNKLGVDVMKTFIKAIKNGGQIGEIKVYSTGAHNIGAAQTAIATFTEHGVSQSLYPLYLEMAQWFEKFGGYSAEEYNQEGSQTYSYSGDITDGTAASGTIASSETKTVRITPYLYFDNPADVTVTNATKVSYDATTGVVTIANPTGDVTITGACQPKTSGSLSVITPSMISVVSTTVGRFTTGNNKRACTGSSSAPYGLLLRNGESITITGISGLRVDYVYATSPGPNPTASAPWSAAVGTGSNYDTTNYFPLNTDGTANEVTITNNHGNDYYYFFAFAGPTMQEVLPTSFNITFSITSGT